MLQNARSANMRLSKRNGQLVSIMMKVELSRARLAGYIDRVREVDDKPHPLGVREADLIEGAATDFNRAPTTEQLLAMNDKTFGKAIDGLSEEELAAVLGRPEEDEGTELQPGLHRPRSY